MSVIGLISVIIAFVLGLLVNIITPRLLSSLQFIQRRLFLNWIYYEPRVYIRTFLGIEKISLVSNKVTLENAGLGKRIYRLNFVIASNLSSKLANFLKRKHLAISFEFSGLENIKYYEFDPQSQKVLSSVPTSNIMFTYQNFSNPNSRAYSAIITPPLNTPEITLNFEYRLFSTHSSPIPDIERKWYHRIVTRNITTFENHITNIITCNYD